MLRSLRATQQLTQVELVLAPRRAWGVRVQRVGFGLLALVLGAAASHLHWRGQLLPLQERAAATQDYTQLRDKLAQSRSKLRVSQARGLELERQVESLIGEVREARDELSFFRKGRAKAP